MEEEVEVEEVPPLTAAEARAQATSEGLTLQSSRRKAGYLGVSFKPSAPKSFLARVKRAGKDVQLGSFATAEEAVLAVARDNSQHTEDKVPPLTAAEARAQATSEGLTLQSSANKAGYLGVAVDPRPQAQRPFKAGARRAGKAVHLGCFATPEEAAGLRTSQLQPNREPTRTRASQLPHRGKPPNGDQTRCAPTRKATAHEAGSPGHANQPLAGRAAADWHCASSGTHARRRTACRGACAEGGPHQGDATTGPGPPARGRDQGRQRAHGDHNCCWSGASFAGRHAACEYFWGLPQSLTLSFVRAIFFILGE